MPRLGADETPSASEISTMPAAADGSAGSRGAVGVGAAGGGGAGGSGAGGGGAFCFWRATAACRFASMRILCASDRPPEGGAACGSAAGGGTVGGGAVGGGAFGGSAGGGGAGAGGAGGAGSSSSSSSDSGSDESDLLATARRSIEPVAGGTATVGGGGGDCVRGGDGGCGGDCDCDCGGCGAGDAAKTFATAASNMLSSRMPCSLSSANLASCPATSTTGGSGC